MRSASSIDAKRLEYRCVAFRVSMRSVLSIDAERFEYQNVAFRAGKRNAALREDLAIYSPCGYFRLRPLEQQQQ